jgi:lipopolysaccharide/colanic/teichoic acid biosynthesis glycosyltransferase
MALVALVLLSPFCLLIVAAMGVEALFNPQARASFFIRGPRVSAGRPFRMWKFRTTSPEGSATWCGHYVRRWYLDEIPQILNIVIGQMSLVGPRPCEQEAYDELLKKGWSAKKELIGGWAGPVQGHKGRSDANIRRQLETDYLHLIKKGDVWMLFLYDFRCIRETLRTMGRGEGP